MFTVCTMYIIYISSMAADVSFVPGLLLDTFQLHVNCLNVNQFLLCHLTVEYCNTGICLWIRQLTHSVLMLFASSMTSQCSPMFEISKVLKQAQANTMYYNEFLVYWAILSAEVTNSRITAFEFLDFSRVFQDLGFFPGLSRPGNLNILIPGLSRVCLYEPCIMCCWGHRKCYTAYFSGNCSINPQSRSSRHFCSSIFTDRMPFLLPTNTPTALKHWRVRAKVSTEK